MGRCTANLIGTFFNNQVPRQQIHVTWICLTREFKVAQLQILLYLNITLGYFWIRFNRGFHKNGWYLIC